MLKYIARITLWMAILMEGWLDRFGCEWIMVNYGNEDLDENDQEKNDGELKIESASVASWDQQVQCSSVSRVIGRVLRSSTRTIRGSNQSTTEEPRVESAREGANSTVVEAHADTTNSRVCGRRLDNDEEFCHH